MGKRATAAQKRHLDRVAEIGCLLCARPAAVHHVKLKPGQSRDHWIVIPLCGRHHQTGGKGVAFHAGQQTWEKEHGCPVTMVIVVYAVLGYEPPAGVRAQIEDYVGQGVWDEVTAHVRDKVVGA